jgi:DnaJ like chaperone protein
MSTTEIFVIAFGLFLGYWVVSKLVSSKTTKTDDDSDDGAANKFSHSSKPAEKPEWFEILKVNSNASAEEIQAAYKSLIRQYHPDKVATLGEELKVLAEEKSKAINAAYQAGLRARGQ